MDGWWKRRGGKVGRQRGGSQRDRRVSSPKAERREEDRLEALRVEDEQESGQAGGGDTWGGSDEEVGVGPRFSFLWTDCTVVAVAFIQLDDGQAACMRKTAATHLLSSPNPVVLELRILANDGADLRFAFLRGRWSRSWDSIKAQAKR